MLFQEFRVELQILQFLECLNDFIEVRPVEADPN